MGSQRRKMKILLLLAPAILICPLIAATDRVCDVGEECTLHDQCPDYLRQKADQLNLRRGSSLYTNSVESLLEKRCGRGRVCCPCPAHRCQPVTSCPTIKGLYADFVGEDKVKADRATLRIRSLVCDKRKRAICCPSSVDGLLEKRINLTHNESPNPGEAYGFAELISDTTVRLTQLHYTGVGPSTNWIVGTKSPIGVDSNTVIIDKLMESGEPVYPDSLDVSKAVPTTPAYNNASLTLTLPVLKDKQMTWSDVNWLALYCRKISLLFMSVNVPQDFARPQLCSSSTSNPLLEKRINLTHNAKSPGEAFGFVRLVSDTAVQLTELHYNGVGPKTNWIVGTKLPIGVDNKTLIIDRLKGSGEPAYADSSDLSDAIPTVSSYHNDALTLSLPVINQVQMTWADVSWLALYCRKLKIVFMSVNVPTDFSDEIIFG